MKKFLRLKYFFMAIIGGFLVILGVEWQDNYRKYGKFRTMQDPIVSSQLVNMEGLRDLPFAGGPMMPLAELKKHLSHIKEYKIIVDDIHGKFGYVQGIPESYLEYRNESPSWKTYFWRLWYTGSLSPHPEYVIPGVKAAELYGFGYQDFHIGSKYMPKDEDVDKFVSFMDTLPNNVYLYFHCLHGKGRTSMMLVMGDIMKNSPKVSLKDIIERQYLLGSENLFDTTHWLRSTYAAQTLRDRKDFIERFYAFIVQRKAGGVQEWSVWNRERSNT